MQITIKEVGEYLEQEVRLQSCALRDVAQKDDFYRRQIHIIKSLDVLIRNARKKGMSWDMLLKTISEPQTQEV